MDTLTRRHKQNFSLEDGSIEQPRQNLDTVTFPRLHTVKIGFPRINAELCRINAEPIHEANQEYGQIGDIL